MRESLKLMSEGKINPAIMITHVGGLDAVVDTTLNLPQIPGGKKLIYTNISMPLVALNKLGELGKKDNFIRTSQKDQEMIMSGHLAEKLQCKKLLQETIISGTL